MSESTTNPPVEGSANGIGRLRRLAKWAAIALGVLYFGWMMTEVLDPFGDKGYTGISHGDHTHYVPEDRDPDVDISQFPTRPPGPGERITRDGRIVRADGR